MAAREGVKVLVSARTFLRLGHAVPKTAVPAVSTSLQHTQQHVSGHRRLALTPAEACLSARLLSPLTGTATRDLRLPPLLKEFTIAPSPNKSAVLDKDLPPTFNIVEKVEPLVPHKAVEMPSSEVTEKLAARMIVIRRRKMWKHKLKKMRKKMKFVLLKIRQKREYRKEKLFQATQMAKVRKYESYDVAEYMKNILDTIKQKPLPRVWRGKRLPKFVIEDLVEKKQLKKVKVAQEKIELKHFKKLKYNYVKTLPV